MRSHPVLCDLQKYRILPLHSQLPTQEQRAVFLVPPEGTTKIVLSTNIAETSVTINDISVVVDAGTHKEMQYVPFCIFAALQFCSFASVAVVIGSDTLKLETFVFFTLSNRYDPSVGMSCLREVRVSKANAAQRAGRAGRVREGFTYHLFLRHEEEEMPAQQLPEMLRCPLESIALRIKTLRLGTACLPSWSN